MLEGVEKVFFLGIGGTAMGNLAVCLKRAGIVVGGSDNVLYPPISDLLAEQSIPVSAPDDLAVMQDWSGSLFIVGNAVSRGHPQVEWLMNHSAEVRCSFPEFLGSYMLRQTRNLVVAGTHGKSTTTSVAAKLLSEGRATAGWFVGGVLADQTPAFTWDPGCEVFAIEGDEYDSAFFDKRSKFVHYRPKVLLINNLEFDHADIFRDTQDVQRSFRQVISLVPGDGTILYNGDDPRLAEMLPVPWAPCLSFGTGEDNDFIMSRVSNDGVTEVSVRRKEEDAALLTVETRLLGDFNARNVAGAALAVRHLCPDRNETTVDLRDFRGLKRRQEIRFQDERRILIEDFGHHPTALSLALKALRESFPGWRLHAMVEPRSNTMRTNRLQSDLIEALRLADTVTLAPIHRQERIPEKERLDSEKIVQVLAADSIPCRFCRQEAELRESFQQEIQNNKTLTVVFSNGAFCGLLGEFVETLRQ
ncbi:UDP-N-acetylmuramate: L-alanyl-gamma-D-glutamyl-meso-diaminopimelate ligase [Puniceicoccus vermicola]